MDRTRRGLLGLLAATTGCLGFGDNEVTPDTVTDSASSPSPTPTATRVPTQSPTATDTLTATDTQTPTDTPTPSPTASPTPTATIRDGQAPPQGSLELARTGINVFPSNPPTARVSATVRNTGVGDAAYTLIELRFDLVYEPPFGEEPEVVGVAYSTRRFDDSPFTGGIETVRGELSLSGTGLDGSEPTERFSLDVAFRRVQYR